MRKVLLAAVVVLIAAAPAMAQDKPVTINLGGGWTFPVSGLNDAFDSGWNGDIGVTFNVSPVLGIQSNHQVHALSFNAVFNARSSDSPVGGYFLGGLGYYHRIIQLTSPAVGFASVCDPYWLVCYPTAVEVDRILGDRSSNDFGINFGGGMTFGTETQFYFEARYHYVWGPEVTATGVGNLPAGGTVDCSGGCSTNAGYFPITFGVRF
jgi:opacity protein-like surface antigen